MLSMAQETCVCSICLDTCDAEDAIYLTHLPCKHIFHSKCIIPYFLKSRTSSCPLCRQQVDVTDSASVSITIPEVSAPIATLVHIEPHPSDTTIPRQDRMTSSEIKFRRMALFVISGCTFMLFLKMLDFSY